MVEGANRMVSSTFSSRRSAPPGSVSALIAGTVAATLLVAATEFAVRGAGLDALTVHDTPERWLQQCDLRGHQRDVDILPFTRFCYRV